MKYTVKPALIKRLHLHKNSRKSRRECNKTHSEKVNGYAVAGFNAFIAPDHGKLEHSECESYAGEICANDNGKKCITLTVTIFTGKTPYWTQ